MHTVKLNLEQTYRLYHILDTTPGPNLETIRKISSALDLVRPGFQQLRNFVDKLTSPIKNKKDELNKLQGEDVETKKKKAEINSELVELNNKAEDESKKYAQDEIFIINGNKEIISYMKHLVEKNITGNYQENGRGEKEEGISGDENFKILIGIVDALDATQEVK